MDGYFQKRKEKVRSAWGMNKSWKMDVVKRTGKLYSGKGVLSESEGRGLTIKEKKR